jgi:multiple sugar transport system substrate-binding protein
MTTLKGITWNHTRGYVPMVATAQRFSETHPDVEIIWEKRSLQAFADYPIEKLAESFDLLVIDHPFVGYAAAHPTLLPLDEYLSPDFLQDQAAHSVGQSHPSYFYSGHQWALAIDAATPIASYRADLLEQLKTDVPRTWEELLELARRGIVAFAAIPVDCLMNFFTFCLALGEAPFSGEGRVVSEETGVAALQHMKQLIDLCPPQCLERNPIATYEAMTSTDEIAYCPFSYGYSNYARPGYARRVLRSSGLVQFHNGQRLRSTLGGTGLAVSRACRNVEAALEYCRLVADAACQRTLYFDSGGQPGHRGAWEDSTVNAACNDFFRNTLQTLDEAYLRPRYDGYLHFQDDGGTIIHRFLCDGGDPRAALRELEELRHLNQPRWSGL